MEIGRDFIGVGVGAVVLNDDCEVLLLLRKNSPERGCWTIPGGRVEFGERVEEAILRELREELGIEGTIVGLLRVTDHIVNEEAVHWVSPAFLVKPVAGTPRNNEPENHAAMKWFRIDSLPGNVTITTRLALDAYRQDVLTA